MTSNLINNYFLFTRMIVEHLPKFSYQAKLICHISTRMKCPQSLKWYD